MKRQSILNRPNGYSSTVLSLLTILLLCAFSFADIIIDNGDTGTSSTGTWGISGGSDPYGSDSLWARNGDTYTWSFGSTASGTYNVYMWWSGWPSRSSDIPVYITHWDGTDQVNINQQNNAGQWNLLGQYYFVSGENHDVTIVSQPYPSSTCADAVWFELVNENNPPIAEINSVSPNPAEPGVEVEFIGQATDDEGPIQAHLWTSDIDGEIGTSESFTISTLSEGTHTITYSVQDSDGIWSKAAEQTLVIGTIPTEIIIDNRDADTSSSGTWAVSGGPDPYGPDSVWSRSGSTFTWEFTAPQPGEYDVYMWWTEWSSRSTNAPVTIAHTLDSNTLYINQQVNGGQWNHIGKHYFETEGSVTLYAPNAYPTSYCADAVRFVLAEPSLAAEFSAIPLSGQYPLLVQFTDDSAGDIIEWAWDFDGDDIIDSNEQNPTYTYTQSGTYTVSLTITDDQGSETLIKTDYITVEPAIWYVDAANVSPGDGRSWVDAFNTIEQALSTAADGDTIHVSGATYNERLVINSQVTLIGDASGLTTVQPLDTPIPGTYDVQIKASGTVIQDIKFDFNGDNDLRSGNGIVISDLNQPPVTDVQLLNNRIYTGHENTGIQTGKYADVSGLLISGNTFFCDTDGMGEGIYVNPFDGNGVVTIQDNEFYGYLYSGISIESGSVEVFGNIIDNDVNQGIYGIRLIDLTGGESFDDIEIANNDIRHVQYGISVGTSTDANSSITTVLELNKIKSNDVGILARYGANITATFNEISDNVTYGINNENSPVIMAENNWWGDPNGPNHPTLNPTGGGNPVSDQVDFDPWLTAWQATAEFTGTPLTGDAPLDVSFTDASSGPINQWQWDFDNDGAIDSNEQNPAYTYTAAGLYSVQLSVSGPAGSDSQTKAGYISVTEPAVSDIIIDNDDPQTTSTGTWQISGGSLPYGDDALWSRNGTTYTWRFTPPQSANFEVYMWWSGWPSRTTNAPVYIQNLLGTATVNVNQQQNAGQWNSLGIYSFEEGQTYNVTIVSQNNPTSTCADAVKFIHRPNAAIPPVASIDSIDPNPVLLGETVTFAGHGVDISGEIVAYQWRSSIDGPLSDANTFSTNSLSEGQHTIYLAVQNGQGIWSSEVSQTLDVWPGGADTEHIFICYAYGPFDQRGSLMSYLDDIGAYWDGDVQIYNSALLHKTFIIHHVEDIAGMIQGLKTPGAHVLVFAHSNYGLGPCFATLAESNAQLIDDLYYIDDERILNISTENVHVSVSGMRTGQAYPNWWPIYQDGNSGIAPYTLDDPNNPAPYNYYITYQLPGDDNYYYVDTPRNNPVERFWGSGVTPWYSQSGAEPDPRNPNHYKYFATNYNPWEPSFKSGGSWSGSQGIEGYFKENYLLSPIGDGSNYAKWMFSVPKEGIYKVLAWWTSSANRPTDAPYTVHHADGNDTVYMNQQTNGGHWNELGEFRFESIQDWFESRYDDPLLVTLNTEDIGGNATKKAHFKESKAGNAYLSQDFDAPQDGVFTLEWDIYIDTILNDSSRDRGGMMLIGTDLGDGPNRGSGPFAYMAMWCPGGGTGAPSTMTLIAREAGDSFSYSTQWLPIASGLAFDTWHHITVECNVPAGTYNVSVNGSPAVNNINAYVANPFLTHISFAQFNDGPGTFAVDNVTSPTPGLVVDSDFEASINTMDLRKNDAIQYNVTLTNDADFGSIVADAIRIAHVNNPAELIQANFMALPRSGSVPLEVSFYNQSTGDFTNRRWEFGDGIINETRDQVDYTYTQSGIYDVSLTVSGPAGESSVTKTGYIRAGYGEGLKAEFYAYNTTGATPLEVSFRDYSTGDYVSRLWEFGDGATSTSSRPSHIYFEPGYYTVSLTVTDADGNSDTETKENFVAGLVYGNNIDNVDYPKRHFGSKTIVKCKEQELPFEEMKYDRLFYYSCNSGNYYLDVYKRGVVFYTLNLSNMSAGQAFKIYLQAYFNGQSNQEIWETLQNKEAIFDYFDFSKPLDDQW